LRAYLTGNGICANIRQDPRTSPARSDWPVGSNRYRRVVAVELASAPRKRFIPAPDSPPPTATAVLHGPGSHHRSRPDTVGAVDSKFVPSQVWPFFTWYCGAVQPATEVQRQEVREGTGCIQSSSGLARWCQLNPALEQVGFCKDCLHHQQTTSLPMHTVRWFGPQGSLAGARADGDTLAACGSKCRRVSGSATSTTSTWGCRWRPPFLAYISSASSAQS